MKVAAREQPPADDFTEMRFCLRASCVRPAPPPLVTPDQLFSSALESFTKHPVVLRVLPVPRLSSS